MFSFPNTVQSGVSNGVGVADSGERTQRRQMRGPGWPSGKGRVGVERSRTSSEKQCGVESERYNKKLILEIITNQWRQHTSANPLLIPQEAVLVKNILLRGTTLG
ncbi:hypothetical protein HZH68_002303 [Vespula germanica]|uniref:Uncharacterized protein n=1 Tax=Vespula germanica TaxID=30212 RepID=A0A834KTM9_VESGE|nr:hypothetical protein HZH68_002303 [Vespula germanica]